MLYEWSQFSETKDTIENFKTVMDETFEGETVELTEDLPQHIDLKQTIRFHR
jgi:hypothetical protein